MDKRLDAIKNESTEVKNPPCMCGLASGGMTKLHMPILKCNYSDA